MAGNPPYDVALSFAGEDREYVEKVADSLRNTGVQVFYDNYERVSLWGKNLYDHLDWVYRQASRYCVVFISEHYSRKVWTDHERQSAQARAFEENKEYLLPVRFDDTVIPGIRPTIGFLPLDDIEPHELADLIRQKLGPRDSVAGFPDDPWRLFAALGLTGDDEDDARAEALSVGIGFWEALGRMTREERTVVAGAFAFGCPGELPEGVHISLDHLSRMTRMPQAQVVDALASVRSLNLTVISRDPDEVHPGQEGELRKEDRDLLISFWSSRAPEAEDPVEVVFHAVQNATNHFCADHGLERIVDRDFYGLAAEDGEIESDDEESATP